MNPHYARSYIDRLYDAKDVFELHGVITLVSKYRELPEQFSLFLRLVNWSGSARSGIWQYYDELPAEEFQSMADALERFGLPELAQQYRSGMKTLKEQGNCDDLDRWIDIHWDELEQTTFNLIANDRASLYDET